MLYCYGFAFSKLFINDCVPLGLMVLYSWLSACLCCGIIACWGLLYRGYFGLRGSYRRIGRINGLKWGVRCFIVYSGFSE